MHTGAVKDSVVGEERLAQYLLAILNTRKTPLHWKHLQKEQTAELLPESKGNHGNPLKESIPNRRRRVNDSDVVYIQVLYNYQLVCALSQFFLDIFIALVCIGYTICKSASLNISEAHLTKYIIA